MVVTQASTRAVIRGCIVCLDDVQLVEKRSVNAPPSISATLRIARETGFLDWGYHTNSSLVFHKNVS